MEIQNSSINNYNHCINLCERKKLNISGVKKIVNFDNEQFLLESIMGFILIKGSELELIKLDTLQGNISISGTINSINYIESEKNDKSSGFIGKLFK